jgi:hypothetical protein
MAQPKTFINYVLAAPPHGDLVREMWGASNVLPRDTRNGLEDTTMKRFCYGDGQIMKAPDGTVNHWNKAERPPVDIGDGHVAAMSLAVIDVEKQQDKGNDGHGSNVIVVPFDGAARDRDLLSAADPPKS